MTRPASDTLSLTLPARSRSRSRQRKWRKPPPGFWIQIACMCIVIPLAVLQFLGGNVPLGLCDVGTAVFAWKAALAAKEGRFVGTAWLYSQIANVFLMVTLSVVAL